MPIIAPNSPIDALRADVNQMLETIHAENPIAATVVFSVTPALEERFASHAIALTNATRQLSGCNLFSFHRAVRPSDPASLEYLIYEDWQTRRQFQRQWNSDHLQAFQAVVGGFINKTPDLRFYTGWKRPTDPPPPGFDLTSWLLLPLQLSMRGMREVGRFLQPPAASSCGCAESTSRPAARFETRSPSPPPAPRSQPPGAQRSQGWGPIPYSLPTTPQAVAGGTSTDTRMFDAFPFESHYQDVNGARMHYIDEGRGDPILLLHGNPTWSYTWRNIIPQLTRYGRCIAPDLIGFGRSSKPDIDYLWTDQAKYLDRFIERLDLRNITLVLHDHGSGLGFHYARRHPWNVKALAFFEALVRPFNWEQFSTPEFRQLFRAFRTGGVHGEGWQLIVDRNIFIEQLLPQAAGRPLSDACMRYYREPFLDASSRVPIWQFARATAIGGEPPDMWQRVSDYSAWLQQTPIPKLLLFAQPGALLTTEHVDWCRRSLPNLETVPVGSGIHFLQESSPGRIGAAITAWLERTVCRGTQTCTEREA